ncbi:LmbU family transcriptional regulator [Solirubrobacter soli]|uniref:LmbU family transcriptional regulator n=1 Tax=Solirubrobacter soli TaxID=363832 RepID=UPI00040BE26D|nr:LmbU family transcriptional regulator [Solirubrobacter soli]
MANDQLRPRSGMSFAEWAELGCRLARISDGSAWALGDWIVFGQDTYGDRYRKALEATNVEYKTLRNYAWVARRFPSSRRRRALSLQHHAQVAALHEAEQDLWLARSETLGWSRAELRRQMAAARREAHGLEADVTVSVRITPERERRWREAAAVAHCDLSELLMRAVDDAVDTLLCDLPAAA